LTADSHCRGRRIFESGAEVGITMISFKQKSQTIENAITGDTYLLQAIDALQPTEDHIEKVTSICNEPELYRWLYREMFDGQPYPSDSAVDWISWGMEGWRDGSHFIFVVLDSSGEVAAACDIKSSDPSHAEIGYWMGKEHKGIMTNAVLAMLDLAEQAGFEGFYAEVHPENERSQAVLQRTGFMLSKDKPQKSGHLVYNRPSKSASA